MKYALQLAIVVLLCTAVYSDTLIFEDDFNNFNLSVWKHEITMSGGGNWEFEMYLNNRSISYTNNSKLYIKPQLLADQIGEASVRGGLTMDIWGGAPADYCTQNQWYGCFRTSGAPNYLNPIRSARIRTAETFSFKYGRVEVVAKLPKGDWLWPAIWLLPKDQSYGLWPASGEIDIMESRGNVGYPKEQGGGPESIGSTLHWGPFFAQNQFAKTHAVYSLPQGTFGDDFHTFGLYWDDKQLYTYVDNDSNKVLHVDYSNQSFWQMGGFPTTIDNPWSSSSANSAPFDQEFYLIMNVAVGGTSNYFPDGVGNKPWANNMNNAMNVFYDSKGQWYTTWNGDDVSLVVDSVKVWSLDGAQTTHTKRF